MKHLIVLVGPQGVGKSTYCKEHLPNHFRISQDDMGKEKHMETFEQALTAGWDIVVDRCGFDREQRGRYISKAKAAGYTTEIYEMFETYGVCYHRMMYRVGHPTIKQGDSVTIRNALDMYFNNYEMIRGDEADIITRSKKNPILWDMTDELKGGRVFAVGDLHGCHSDLLSGLVGVNFDTATDDLIICGDIVDRGPHIMEIILNMMYEGWYSVRGNHDDKFIRWLKGNKVNTESLKETIRQFEMDGSFTKDELYIYLMGLPYMIKYGNNLITHAGFYPDNPGYTSREFSMYARKYDPSMRTFTNDNSKPYWYTFLPTEGGMSYYFGHEIHDTNWNPHPGVYAMDGGCYLGNKLRIAEMNKEGFVQMNEFQSGQPKAEKEKEWDHMNKLEPYDKLVEQGYLNKQESGDLVLYNYTDLCTYEKKWNKYTLESRGIIFNKATGDTVARPFPKFFNLGENENVTLNKMPKESYECYEKLDGSLGILYKDQNTSHGMWRIATRGSFNSMQALKGTEMFNNVPEYEFLSYSEIWDNYLSQYHDYTLLFEIIYPENRVNPGARLVIDYGSKETLVLLGAIHKVTGKDLHRWDLEIISESLGLPLAKKFDYTIEQMIEMQKTLPATEEGFVVKYASGFRVKIKGHEYLKMHRILNSITPLFIWELMKETEDFSLPEKYLITIPEEILPEVREIAQTLIRNYYNVSSEIAREYAGWFGTLPTMLSEKETLKSLGLYTQNPSLNLKHGKALFAYYKNDVAKLRKYIVSCIRPKANKMEIE